MSSYPDVSDWPICTACGTQFPTGDDDDDDKQRITTCFICDDPRQFTPPSGQSFTTLRRLSSESSSPTGHAVTNEFRPYSQDDRITFIHTVPKVAIGQRCALLRTPAGNILWDCITLLDDDTVQRIRQLGGIRAIVISHPHYYSTHLLWARTFDCSVYLAREDEQWLAQRDQHRQIFLAPGETELDLRIGGNESGVKVLKLGGHFAGSLVLLFDGRLLIADTLVTTPSGLGSWETDAAGTVRTEGHLGRPRGMNSFTFMWSIPNMIPLPPDELAAMWKVLEKHDFRSTHGAFMGQDIEDKDGIKKRVLESMQIQVRAMGWSDHQLLKLKA